MAEVWRHKKTGNLYELLSHVMDCTNSRDGTLAVLYTYKGSTVPLYVREQAEFLDKFERVADNGEGRT